MAAPAPELHAVVVQLDPDELAWLAEHARRSGLTEDEALRGLLRAVRNREAQQAEARDRVLAYLGEAARLGPGEEAAVLRELTGDD